MHKEIFEQPRAVADTIRGRASLEQGDVVLRRDGAARGLRPLRCERVVIVACGTSLARRPGRTADDRVAGADPVPGGAGAASSATATRWWTSGPCASPSPSRARPPTPWPRSGWRRSRGARAYAICNVVGSAVSRECDGGTLFTRAGPEIGVASTKAFTTQLAALFLVAVKLGRLRGTLTAEQGARAAGGAPAPAALDGADDPPGGGAHAHRQALRGGPRTCSSWGAATSSRWRWRERSSSRRSPTSTPRATPPAR